MAIVTVSGGIAPPAAASEPGVKVSLHRAPQHRTPCHGHQGNYAWLGSCLLRTRRFQYPEGPVIKPWFSRGRYLIRCRSHVGLSLALPRAFASWEILRLQGVGWLPTLSTVPIQQRAHAGFPRSVYPLRAAVGWCFTPGALRVERWSDHQALHPDKPIIERPALAPYPFGCSLRIGLRRTNQIRLLDHHDASGAPSLRYP